MRLKKGFTLIEILIVVAILSILIIMALAAVTRSIERGRDGRRKSDLHKIANALEERNNDKGGYPQTMTDCGEGALLSPYVKDVPCDPITKQPYKYVSSQCTGTVCRAYNLFTILANKGDDDIKELGCDDSNGCYQEGSIIYDYGRASGTAVEISLP